MRLPTIFLAATAALAPLPALAQVNAMPGELQHYDVTIRRFDPTHPAAAGQSFVLPVDSPDEEHAAASTLANAASFSRKITAGRPLPVAFMVVAIAPRR